MVRLGTGYDEAVNVLLCRVPTQEPGGGAPMASNVMATYQRLADAVERALDERRESEKLVIQVGSATCENAAGADDVRAEFDKHIKASGRTDIVLRQTGCTGRCSREPIVDVSIPGHLPVKYELVTRELVHEIFTSHVLGGEPVTDHILDAVGEPGRKYEFLVCKCAECSGGPEGDFGKRLTAKLHAAGIGDDRCVVLESSCFGLCQHEQVGKVGHVLVRPGKVLYRVTTEADLDEIIASHVQADTVVERLVVEDQPASQRFFELYGDVAFFNRQTRLALRNSGVIDPESIQEKIHYKGFAPLATVLDSGDPQWVIDQVTASGLRGRGGGGFPTGTKWASAATQPSDVKYIICNADEGDPGAFMDRSMLEGDPFSVVEGMTIGAFAIGAHQGYIYVRAEYPLAIERLENAIALAREHGLLGTSILGSGFDFDIEIRLGAGAFVCGEETALIHSIEGERGQPRIRPPYPSQSGLWGKPTVINNVETFANIPVVLYYGAEWFRRIGTEHSGGTKVFALAGKVRHTGIVEVPMGTTVREIVFDIGGGVPDGKRLKAVQTGGPAGGCIPQDLLDTPVDFDTLGSIGTIMGSGGMIVMDETDCMVDIAKYFLTFIQDESCGKCTPCREGSKRMLEILERITTGKGELADIDKLERLARLMKKASLCGLGRAGPNPVLSTLRHFRDEYIAHVTDKQCPAKKCRALVRYRINPDLCVGCTACYRVCPVECIAGKPKTTHEIDETRCIRCGRCFQTCRFGAIERL